MSWFIKRRFHQIALFMEHPADIQNEVLFSLLYAGKGTIYGKKYGFSDINSYQDFASSVPVVSYEDFEPYISKARKGMQNVIWPGKIKWFAKSSGTTNAKSKFIPVTQESLHECHFKAGRDMLSIYCNNNPKTQIFAGKNLRLGGSQEIYQNYETYYGDLSAILINNMPFWLQLKSTPTRKTSLMSEWESKLKAITKEVVSQPVSCLAGVPSWMLVLLQNILKEADAKTIVEVWPRLEVFFHGGISFVPYKMLYEEIIGKPILYYEIYNASEGFFAIQDHNENKDLLLMLDYGIFYEFIPIDAFEKGDYSTAIPLGLVQKDVQYAMLITTNGGLWRYLIGDTVRFTSIKPYRIRVSGRTKHFINAFGEELIIENAELALEKAMQVTDARIKNYTAAPIFMKKEESGCHQWLIEFEQPPNSIDMFTSVLDQTLQELNSDYQAKRYKNITLKDPEIILARAHLFYDWLKQNKKLGGQNKVPRLANDRLYIDVLLQMNQVK